MLFEDTVSMNNAGTVAYIATGGANWGVYAGAGNGGPTATIMTAANFGPLSVLNGADINDSGTVAFRARLAVIGGYGIWQGNGTADPAPVFQQTGSATYVTAPAISNSGEIAYAWRNMVGDTIVKTTSGDVLTPATPYNDGFTSQAVTGVDRIDINNAGDLAFDGDWAFGGSLFVRNNGVLTRPANADVIAAINDDDLLAALVINGATSSLRVGTGTLSTTVISTGSALDGSTVTGLAFNPEGLNDAGWVAFRATLADGRQGVYVASVPEPASAGAISLAGVVLAARRRRR